MEICVNNCANDLKKNNLYVQFSFKNIDPCLLIRASPFIKHLRLAAQSSLIIKQTCTRIFGEYRNENEDFLTKFLFCLRNVSISSYVSNKWSYSFIIFQKKKSSFPSGLTIFLSMHLFLSVYLYQDQFVPYPFTRDLKV